MIILMYVHDIQARNKEETLI